MSNKQWRNPKTQPQAETERKVGQISFNGQLSDGSVPLTAIGLNNTYKSINMDNYGEWAQGRIGSKHFAAMPSGTVYAHMDHVKSGVVCWLIDSTVWISGKDLATFETVVNISGETIAGGDANIEPDNENAILSTTSGIYRLVLNDARGYYFYPVNQRVPNTMLSDVDEDVDNDVVYGYNYTYTLARLTGSGDRTRVSDPQDVILEFETGTSKYYLAEKPWSQKFYDTPAAPGNLHPIGTMQVPDSTFHYTKGITHFSVYRTKNIGSNSGGRDPQSGQGNNSALFVWVDDVPIIKPISFTINSLTATATKGKWSEGDVGESINSDIASIIIDGYISPTQVTVTGPGSGDGSVDGAIGASNVFTASQTGQTITRTGGDGFVAGLVGFIMFWADGSYSHIIGYTDGNTLVAQWSEDHDEQASAMIPSGRGYNDTTRDDGVGVGEVGLHERINTSPGWLYIPPFGYQPLPNANISRRDESFFLSATRDESQFFYSAIGAKPYILGQHKPDVQYDITKRPIRQIVAFPNQVCLVLVDGTYSVSLNTNTDEGNADVGESIPKLFPLNVVDENIGVVHWASIARVNSNLIMALTQEPAFRLLDGHNWSARNYAVTSNGKKAVQADIEALDPTYDVIAAYNIHTGYVIWFWRWVDAGSTEFDNVIIDTPGDSLPEDDTIIDTTGGALPSSETIVDTPGAIDSITG